MFRRILKHCFRFKVFSWDLELSFKLQRNQLRKNAIRTTLVVLPLALLYYGISGQFSAPHEFSDTECFNCHFTIPSEGETRPYRFVKPVDSLCISCHDDLDPVSHYDNRSTFNAYVSGFPVTMADNITCATCHDPHMSATDPATGKKTYFLRGSAPGKDECMLCHEDLNASGFSLFPVMDRAHGVANFTLVSSFVMDYSGRHLDIRDALVTLDALSVFCLGCHDNPDNPELTTPGSELYAHGSDTGLSHPIGVDYGEAAWRNKELRLRDMDERLLLFDGKIGCCTCHDPYKPGGMELRIGSMTSYTELCLGCHLH